MVVGLSVLQPLEQFTLQSYSYHDADVICLVMVMSVDITIYGKTFEWENFRGFHGFSLNCKCFLTNYGLGD